MTTYQVSFQQMEFVGGEMEAIVRNIAATLQSLDEASKSSLANWESSTREAYNIAKAKWDQAAFAMQQQADMAVQSLGQINEFYTGGEKYGVSLWQG
jgi:uncharacterized protein YukE